MEFKEIAVIPCYWARHCIDQGLCSIRSTKVLDEEFGQNSIPTTFAKEGLSKPKSVSGCSRFWL